MCLVWLNLVCMLFYCVCKIVMCRCLVWLNLVCMFHVGCWLSVLNAGLANPSMQHTHIVSSVKASTHALYMCVRVICIHIICVMHIMCTHTLIYTYIYIYIYRERERCMYIYIYIYTCIYAYTHVCMHAPTRRLQEPRARFRGHFLAMALYLNKNK